MQTESGGRYRLAWAVTGIVLVATLVAWGIGLGGALTAHVRSTVPISQPTDSVRIVTINADLGPPNTADLCAQLDPTPPSVIVESVAGTILSTVRCRSHP